MRAEICELPAYEIVARLQAGDLSAEAVLDATLARIEAVEGGSGTLEEAPNVASGVHAYITLTEARATNRCCMRRRSSYSY